MSAPVAVLAVGNRSRGDDAVAPLLLDRLREWLARERLSQGFALIEEYQLQVENALDLEGRSLALFLDAAVTRSPEVTLEEVRERPGPANSHALQPAAVLDVFRRITGLPPPPAFVLRLPAREFALGAEPGEQARVAMQAAWPLLRALALRPRRDAWQALAGERQPASVVA